VDESFVMLESAVEREEEREGNSGSGRGDRQIGDGDTSRCGASLSCGVSMSCVVSTSSSRAVSGGIYLSGRGGTSSLASQSGHAPGQDGVGDVASMMLVREKEKEEQRKGDVKQRKLLG